MRAASSILAAAITLAPAAGRAEQPRFWDVEGREDFLKGTPLAASVTGDGRVVLPPVMKETYSGEENLVWSAAAGDDGSVYVGMGDAGKVLKVLPSGATQVAFKAQEMFVTALAVLPSGELLAGTSPKGKIYRIAKSGAAVVFAEPGSKYIWDLLAQPDGAVYAATGEPGLVVRIGPDGKLSEVLKAPEAHVKSLAAAPAGALIAGGGQKGMVYRIEPSGKVAVLHDSTLEEITAVAVAPDGAVYASAMGSRKTPEQLIQQQKNEAAKTPAPPLPPPPPPPQDKQKTLIKSELYRIEPDLTVRTVWESKEDHGLAIAFTPKGAPILATGGRGYVYSIRDDGDDGLLLKIDSKYVQKILKSGGRLIAVSGGACRVTAIDPVSAGKGAYISEVFDAAMPAELGSMTFTAVTPEHTAVDFETRSGNTAEPDGTWSDWKGCRQEGEEARIEGRTGRYFQWKALMYSEKPELTPSIEKVSISYLRRNAAPQLGDIYVFPKSAELRMVPKKPLAESTFNLEKDQIEKTLKEQQQQAQKKQVKKTRRDDFISSVWESADPNGDNLEFRLYLQGPDETGWRFVKATRQNTLALDVSGFPEGEYRMKVVASDLPSNPPDRALGAEKVSRYFVIDNSAPRIAGLRSVASGKGIQVSFTAEDGQSRIVRAWYRIDRKRKVVVLPSDGITDSKREEFDFEITGISAGEHTISLGVEDEAGNAGVSKVVGRFTSP